MLTPLLLSLVALTSAQDIYSNLTTIQSPPFNLVVKSSNSTLNNLRLAACHIGAAEEALCALLPSTYTDYSSAAYIYKLNITFSQCYYENGTLVPDCGTPSSLLNSSSGYPGLLVWDLPFSSGVNNTLSTVSQAVSLQTQGASSNMAFTIISFADGTNLAFDSEGKLNFQDDLDEGKTGPDYGGDGYTTHAYYRWWICRVAIGSYRNEFLTWTYGEGEASNKACQPVQISRVFI